MFIAVGERKNILRYRSVSDETDPSFYVTIDTRCDGRGMNRFLAESRGESLDIGRKRRWNRCRVPVQERKPRGENPRFCRRRDRSQTTWETRPGTGFLGRSARWIKPKKKNNLSPEKPFQSPRIFFRVWNENSRTRDENFMKLPSRHAHTV